MQPYVKDQYWEYFHCYECQPNTGYLSPNVRPLANSYPPKQPFKSSFSIETLLGGGTERGWRPANVVPPTQPEKTTSVSAKLREFEERRRKEKEKQSFYAATSQASGATKNEAQRVQDGKKAYSSPYGKSFLCSHSKNKRPRTMFTLCQLERMEREFLRRQYITGNQRQKLAEELQLSETQVRVWFQNRRIKWRKQMIKSQFNNF